MLPRKTLAGLVAWILGTLALTGGVDAAELTRVVSAGDPDDAFDFNVSVAWLREQKSAHLRREAESAASAGVIGSSDDLLFKQVRNVLHARADFGILPDLGLYLAMPFVLSDDRQLDFDRSAATCAAGATGCVDENTSTLLRDGFLPSGSAGYGLDAEHERRFMAPSKTVFRGPTRQGMEYLGVGLNWAVMNQERDDTKPNWLVRFETRFDLTSDLKFDPAKPKANTGVGLGYHQLVFSTAFSRRFSFLNPYMGGWYMMPINSEGSVYKANVYGQNAFSGPQHRAGVEAGLEGVIWQQPRAEQRIAIELRGRYEARFLGLAQGDMFEVLSGSSACESDQTACRAGIDKDRDGDGRLDPNPGVTRSPSYGVLGGDAGLVVQSGPHVRFRGLFGVGWEGQRFMTDGRSGNVVYDVPGRRYIVSNATTWSLLLDGALLW